MKLSHLKNAIKQVVRECITEREYQQLLNEVSPPGKKAERMIQHVKTSLRKSHPEWDEDKVTSVAIGTGWKAHNAGSVEEGGSKDTDGLTKITKLVIERIGKDHPNLEELISKLYQHKYGNQVNPEEVKHAIDNSKSVE